MEKKNDVRHEDQQIVVNKYLKEKPKKSTLVLSTSFGKSKVTIDIIKGLGVKDVLILSNSTTLRDKTWKTEFEKFGMADFYEQNVVTVTYQAAYKWTKDRHDLSNTFIVADEVDFAGGTVELAKFFYEYESSVILGITGFITNTKRLWFANHLPIMMEFSADQAQEKGILNNIHFVFVKYDLSKNKKDIKVEYKKHGIPKSFTQSENSAYDYADNQYRKALAEKNQLAIDVSSGTLSMEDYAMEIISVDYKIKNAVTSRSNILVKSITSASVAKNLIAHLTEDETNRIIVFSKRTEQSNKICGKENVYNGSIRKSRAENNYLRFRIGKTNVLGVCDKINRGENIDRLNVAIFESFYGSDTDATQRFGRLMRLEHDEVATVYILLPYFMQSLGNNEYKLAETQQINWARKMLSSTNVKSSEVWDYRAVKEDPV